MKIVFTMLIIILTQQTLLVADWEKCNTPQNGDFYHISKFGDYYFGATRWNGIARSSDSSNTWEILNNGLKGKSITLIIPSQKSIYIFSNGDVYKSEDFGVTVNYIKNTYFVNQKKYTYSYHNDTLFFIYDKILKYYVDDFNKLEDIFTQKDSILCNRIFEINGDLIVSTNKGYFRKQNDSYKFIKFDGLDSLPNILYFSTTDDTTYFATEESIFKSDDNLESYTKIFELKDYSISDIQANVDGLFVAFLKRGIGFYNCITKEFEFEEKYKNIGFNKITLIDDNIFFFNDLNLLRTKKIGGEYLVSDYKNSLLSKVRLSNGKIFGILTGRLMTSDDDGLNWHAKGKDFLNLKSFEVIDSVIFIANYNKKEGTEATTFRSSNFGKEWELIPKNKNSPFVANDFLYFNNDLFVAGGVGIFGSNDIGKTWFIIDSTIHDPDKLFAIDSFLFVTGYFSSRKIYLNENYLSTKLIYHTSNANNFMIPVNDDIILCTNEYSYSFYYLSTDRGNNFVEIKKPIKIPRHYLYNETVKKQIIDSTLHFSFDDGITWINLFDEKGFEFYDFFIMNNYVIANTSQGLYRKKLSNFGVTSVKMPIQDVSIVVSPNPATEFITIHFSNKGLQPFAAEENVQIFDVLGIEVISESIHPMTSSHQMNVEKLPAGVYFIRIGNKIDKFVKM